MSTVVKLGGGVLAHPERFRTALDAIAGAAHRYPLLVVPGGGPFADAVRAVDRHLGLSDEAAHWMAVLGMDQYALLIASRLPDARLVTGPSEIELDHPGGPVQVLAPYRWIRDADPLPYGWDVTSDSIAAWIAGALGARRLLLVKPPGARGGDLVDPYFPLTVPPAIQVETVPADRLDALLQPA